MVSSLYSPSRRRLRAMSRALGRPSLLDCRRPGGSGTSHAPRWFPDLSQFNLAMLRRIRFWRHA